MYATYYVNQGIVAQKAKKVDEAEGAFKQALAIQPDNVNALNSLGVLLYSQGAATLNTDAEKAKGQFKESKEYLEKLIPLLSPSKPAQKKMIDNANTMLNFINTQL